MLHWSISQLSIDSTHTWINTPWSWRQWKFCNNWEKNTTHTLLQHRCWCTERRWQKQDPFSDQAVGLIAHLMHAWVAMKGECIRRKLIRRQSIGGNEKETNKWRCNPNMRILIQSPPIYYARGRRVAARRLRDWRSKRLGVHNRDARGKRAINNITGQH